MITLLQTLRYQTYKRPNKSNLLFLLSHFLSHKGKKKKENPKAGTATNDHINYPLNSNHNFGQRLFFFRLFVIIFFWWNRSLDGDKPKIAFSLSGYRVTIHIFSLESEKTARQPSNPPVILETSLNPCSEK